MDVKRYDPEGCECCYMEEVTDGDYVDYVEYSKLEMINAELNDQYLDLQSRYEELRKLYELASSFFNNTTE